MDALREPTTASPARRLALACLLSTAFGSGLAAIRVGVGYFPPLTFTMLRLVLVIGAFGVFFGVAQRRPQLAGGQMARLLMVGVLSVAVPFTCAGFALRLVSSTLVSIMLNLTPVLSVVLAHFVLPDERLVGRTVLGVGVAVVGASLVIWGGADAALGGQPMADSASALWAGIGLTLLNTLALSVSNVLLRLWFRNADTMTVTVVQLMSGLAVSLPLALLIDGWPRLASVPWQGWAALVWSGMVGSFVGYLTSFYILLHFGVTTSAISSTGTPLVTALVGVLLLDETITALMVFGALLLICGVLVVNLRPQARGDATSGE